MECKQLEEGVQLGKVLAKRVLAHETDGALKVFSDLLEYLVDTDDGETWDYM